MSNLTLYYHPFAAYCQKVLIALYENGTGFTPLAIDLGDEAQRAQLAAAWPMVRFPVLKDAAKGLTLPESTIIIEYLTREYPGGFAAIPEDVGLQARLWDRFFDNYVMTPMQTIVFNRLRPADAKDPYGVAQAREMLATAYRLLEERLGGRTWAAGEAFTLAECAAAPSLFYADWVEPFRDYPNVSAYFDRLMARPSFHRVVEEARPYRHFFPQEDQEPVS